MKEDETLTDLKKIVRYTELALESTSSKREYVISELKRWKSEMDIEEVKKSLQLVLEKSTKWLDEYERGKNILCIGLKEYDVISKKTSYLVGEAALVDDLHTEVINHLVMCIGSEMCEAIRNGGMPKE